MVTLAFNRVVVVALQYKSVLSVLWVIANAYHCVWNYILLASLAQKVNLLWIENWVSMWSGQVIFTPFYTCLSRLCSLLYWMPERDIAWRSQRSRGSSSSNAPRWSHWKAFWYEWETCLYSTHILTGVKATKKEIWRSKSTEWSSIAKKKVGMYTSV